MSIKVDFDDYYLDAYTDVYTYIPPIDAAPCLVSSPVNKYAVVVIYATVFLLNVVGNSLVILVLCYNRLKRSSTDIYLLNLALADLLFSITLPFWAAYKSSEWTFGIAMCKIISILQEVNFYSGVFFLACISVDRYLAIVHATEFFTKKKLWVKILTIAIWIISFGLSIPTIWFRDVFVSHKRGAVCHENLEENTEDWMLNIRIGRHVMGFFIPLLIMLFCYGFVIKTLIQTRNSQKQRAMKVILAVFFVFLICWLPHNITVMVDSLMRKKHINETCLLRNQLDTALYITEVFGFTHSCINPILYAFIGHKFRHSFLTILANKGIISKDRLSSYGRSLSVMSSSAHTSTTI
ncbi:C-X-C chemokine receptor type 2-like [Bufo gargarizans]|uniref:C-X-C chemokine receptor type 2-like n=1 Tax=Bufo gargarizans TaxID=30331 RepID=UPI001CF0D934|nr:C-X-C chemokine receptor type 2-like [Bufo gargarizans]XP_044160299.1 C-X-C chemokine receptor type 2-like [Bufo gargarizans]